LCAQHFVEQADHFTDSLDRHLEVRRKESAMPDFHEAFWKHVHEEALSEVPTFHLSCTSTRARLTSILVMALVSFMFA